MHTDLDRIAFLLETDADAMSLDLEAVAESEKAKYKSNYRGSKQKLVEWIWRHTPEHIKTVFDGFTGSATVAYMYKTKGLQVIASDRLRFCYHMARAIIENKNTRLSEEDIDRLLADNPKAGTFVRDHFKGKYFLPGIHQRVDVIRANIEQLSGYKTDIALFALARACMLATDHGHFSSTTPDRHKSMKPGDFDAAFRRYVARINELVFDNGRDNKVLLGDIHEVMPKVKADLAYFDPPYATQFSTSNYTASYHFVEGLMTNWDGLKIKKTTMGDFETDQKAVTFKMAPDFFQSFLSKAAHFPSWMISYRDKANPTVSQLKGMLSKLDRDVSVKSKDHKYIAFNVRPSEANQAKEYLLVAHSKASSKQAKAEEAEPVEETLSVWTEDSGFELLSCQAGLEPILVAGYLGNKYTMLPWIERFVPKGTKTFMDAFSGGANVSYHFKRLGFRVISNDLLKYSFHLARAVIENNHETLSDDDVEMVLGPNDAVGTFIVDNFSGFYYTKPILEWLERVWTNIQNLKGYRKDIALAALGNTVKAHSTFGQFHRTKKNQRSKAARYNQLSDHIPISSVEKSFRRSVRRLNSLVFDNGQQNKVLNLDVLAAMKQTTADVVYLDPPYVTEFENNNYEKYLHFLEGLMTLWNGKTLNDNAVRNFKTSQAVNQEGQFQLFKNMISQGTQGFETVILSYRDHAFPREAQIMELFGDHFHKVEKSARNVDYKIAKSVEDSPGRFGKELLFVASSARKSPRSKPQSTACHTSIPVNGITLSAEASEQEQAGDPQFRCVLCREGTNLNGDHFTREELATRYTTAINKKVDLKHSQEFSDIVGGIVGADFMEDELGARVEVVGELFPNESKQAALAHKLMRKGIVSQVSMECDYIEGECSICSKRVKSKSDYCVHLAKYKGGTFQGKPVYEILHGVTFTGLALLDRKGADENAKITQVASSNPMTSSKPCKGESPMDEKAKEQAEAADQSGHGNGGGGASGPPASEKERLLKEENHRLKQQLLELSKRLEQLEAEKKAAASLARAENLMARFEEKGVAFASPDARKKELERLAGLSDEAFAATEASLSFMPNQPKPAPAKSEKPEASASLLSSAASVRPHDVNDADLTLQQQLTDGLMAAYKERVATASGKQ